MTIAAAVATWLSYYENISIDTNHISDGSDQYGLFKSPLRSVKDFTNGSYEITENYQFFARQASVSEDDRVDADEWLEDLAYWADDFPFEYAYPSLGEGDNRKITLISITGTPYPMETGSSDMLFQMSLSVTYTREREV